jgi:Phosphodiester glycosidase
MELNYLPVQASNLSADSRITVLRIDPKLWQLEAVGSSQTGESSGHTAREWCDQHKLTAAINAGMFKTDGKTHVGYLGFREHVNNSKVNDYQSIAAFDPRDPSSSPPFRIFDLDAPQVTFQSIVKEYASAVQNLRLVKRPGTNQWTQQTRMWSEAALGEDESGRVLFIFSRTPFSMHDLNQQLLAAGIGLVAAQHLEGGPEAQLYLHVGDMQLEQFGSYETSFKENDSNATPWPIPNVLGVRPRAPTSR